MSNVYLQRIKEPYRNKINDFDMSKVQYNYTPDRLASPKAAWIDEPAAASTVYQPSVQDPHFPLAAYLTRMQSC